jgi:hypothetical protein
VSATPLPPSRKIIAVVTIWLYDGHLSRLLSCTSLPHRSLSDPWVRAESVHAGGRLRGGSAGRQAGDGGGLVAGGGGLADTAAAGRGHLPAPLPRHLPVRAARVASQGKLLPQLLPGSLMMTNIMRCEQHAWTFWLAPETVNTHLLSCVTGSMLHDWDANGLVKRRPFCAYFH